MRYPNSKIKEIKTDLYNNVNELLDEINYSRHNVIYRNEILLPDELLIKYNIQSDVVVKLEKRKTYIIYWKVLTDK